MKKLIFDFDNELSVAELVAEFKLNNPEFCGLMLHSKQLEMDKDIMTILYNENEKYERPKLTLVDSPENAD